jgi:hypothetical protein
MDPADLADLARDLAAAGGTSDDLVARTTSPVMLSAAALVCHDRLRDTGDESWKLAAGLLAARERAVRERREVQPLARGPKPQGMPPSTASTAPVVKLDASLAK